MTSLLKPTFPPHYYHIEQNLLKLSVTRQRQTHTKSYHLSQQLFQKGFQFLTRSHELPSHSTVPAKPELSDITPQGENTSPRHPPDSPKRLTWSHAATPLYTLCVEGTTKHPTLRPCMAHFLHSDLQIRRRWRPRSRSRATRSRRVTCQPSTTGRGGRYPEAFQHCAGELPVGVSGAPG